MEAWGRPWGTTADGAGGKREPLCLTDVLLTRLARAWEHGAGWTSGAWDGLLAMVLAFGVGGLGGCQDCEGVEEGSECPSPYKCAYLELLNSLGWI